MKPVERVYSVFAAVSVAGAFWYSFWLGMLVLAEALFWFALSRRDRKET